MKKNLLIIILLLFTSTWSIGQEAPDKSGPKEIVKTLKSFEPIRYTSQTIC